MARLGKKPVVIPEKVKLTVDGRTLVASGEKGSLTLNLPGELSVSSNNRELVLQSVVSSGRKKTFRRGDQLLGLYRKLILNMLEGVTRGFEKILEIHGVGYKAELKDNQLFLHLGFTHPVVLEIPTGITVQIVKDTIIYVRGYDKEKVGSFSSKIRSVCPPEPYKGTGIRYRGEYVRQKVGKAAAGGTK